jgi:phosphatidylglycerophosphate synthase
MAMAVEKPLKRSVVIYIAGLAVIQTAILCAVHIAYAIDSWETAAFTGIVAAYHAGLGALLFWRIEDFRFEADGAPLKRMNPSNALTLFRVSSIPSALFLILMSRRAPLLPIALPFLFLVFVTDFFDGMLARARGEITVVGRYLDSVSDYLVLIATSIAFFVFGLIPAWFFILVLSRLVIFAVFMAVAALKQGKPTPIATFLGKASIFAVMLLYLLETAEYFSLPVIGYPPVVRIVEILTAAVIVASILDKAIFLRKLFREEI